MTEITIDQNKCLKDGACAQVCPRAVLRGKPGEIPRLDEQSASGCLDCGHCLAICPADALRVQGRGAADLLPLPALGGSGAVEAAVRRRRSVRLFLPEAIEAQEIEAILDAVRYAPSGANSQRVSWLVINGPQKVHELAQATMRFVAGLIEQDHPLAKSYGLSRLVRAWEAGQDGIFRSAPALVLACAPGDYGLAGIDATIALSYFDLLAQSRGLGCCWAGFFMIAAAQSPLVRELVALPAGQQCYGGLMVGKPRVNYRALPIRKPSTILWR